MEPTRRDLFKYAGSLAVAATAGQARRARGAGHEEGPDLTEARGVLVDLTECIGCRLCEYACKKANGIEPGALASYDNTAVLKEQRRPSPVALTVLNAYEPQGSAGGPVYTKVNCLHCNRPACVSACIVGALKKQENGAVTYDAWKCIGCRYCMLACPFQIPTYEYDNVLTPQVRKCEFCKTRTEKGQLPACVQECPRQALTYGRREDLLALAKKKIADHPQRYVNHVYGEHEVGGTSWMYLSGARFEEVGFPKLGSIAPSALTEKIQHGVFSPRLGLPPLLLYGVLGGTMWLTARRARLAEAPAHTHVNGARREIGSRVHRHAEILVGGNGHPANDNGGSVAVLEGPREEEPRIRSHGHEEHGPMPARRRLLTPGVRILLMLMFLGLVAAGYRFFGGLSASTNLDQQHPWGIWIAIDVASGVVTAAGGFTSAFLIYILGRRKYMPLARPALLTAMLGYTFVCIGLQADLGRYYNVWHPMVMWNGNSVLFEVGMCVMCYLTVLYAEFAPIFATRLMGSKRFPRLGRLATFAHDRLERIMFLFIIAGCVLSCLHQSSLGNLIVIAPYKFNALWWSPISPLLFLLSAFMIGFPMIIFESLLASWSLKLKPEMHVLSSLARFVPFTAGVYLAVKVGDVVMRGAYVELFKGGLDGTMWLCEMILGVVVPAAMLSFPSMRRSPRWLFTAALMIVLGVILNRINVFLIAYHPAYSNRSYFPSLSEIGLTVGLVATLMLIYRVIVTYFPVITAEKPEAAA